MPTTSGRRTIVERQVAALEAAGPGACMAFADTVFVDMDGRPVPAAVWCPWETRTGAHKAPETDFRGLLLRNSVANGSAAVFRRDRMLEAGGYDEGLARRRRTGRGGLEIDADAGRARDASSTCRPRPCVTACHSSGMSGAVPAMRRGVLMVIDHARRHRTAPGALELLARPDPDAWRGCCRAPLRAGQWRQALGLAVDAYVLNPLWWVKPEPWTLIWRTCTTGVAEVLGLRRRPAQRR